MRDPFANYDAWKTTDREQERADRIADFLAEHTVYETDCCGREVELEDEWTEDTSVICPECKDWCCVVKNEPDTDGGDEREEPEWENDR